MAFIRAKKGPPPAESEKYTVHYFDEQGNVTIRSEGSKAWRNNNPGNMVYRPKGFASRHGAIGEAGGMAVFPDEATGRKALIDLLKSENYRDLKISDLSEKYEPLNPENHRQMLLSISKLDPNKRIRDLTAKEFDCLRITLERIEGWDVGNEDFIEKWYIAGVHKKRKIIFEYLIAKNKHWVSKAEAVELASADRLHAIVVHMKNGSTYLRPEYHAPPFQIVST